MNKTRIILAVVFLLVASLHVFLRESGKKIMETRDVSLEAQSPDAPDEKVETREMTPAERNLVRWMLEHGEPEATSYLDQLKVARVTTWRCGCGCASFNLSIPGSPAPPPGIHILGEFLIEENKNGYSAIYVFGKNGVLEGVEVHGVPNAPKILPNPEQLKAWKK